MITTIITVDNAGKAGRVKVETERNEKIRRSVTSIETAGIDRTAVCKDHLKIVKIVGS
jgi:hypothetical protein